MNDPHGLVFAEGLYHLFFQLVPHSTRWAPGCHWGHATSPDLLSWTEQEVALTPDPDLGEIGCWSGSLVMHGGEPVIAYTRIAGDDWTRGQVALAVGSRDFATWRRQPAGSVVAGPPAGAEAAVDDVPDLVAFRDPYVWRVPDGWRMLVGAGAADSSGLAVQYSSEDLETWTCDGVVARRGSDQHDSVWTGQVWECPQLFELDGRWVLLASAWADQQVHHTFYAVGDYDGRRFTPASWGLFGHGDVLYAATTFVDEAARRCSMSWLRERGNQAPSRSPYAGAMSIPVALAVDGLRLFARPHPRLLDAARRRPALMFGDERAPTADVSGALILRLRHDALGGAQVTVEVAGAEGTFTLEVDHRDAEVTVRVGEEAVLAMPLPRGAGSCGVSAILDTDLLELFVDDVPGLGAARVPANTSACLRVSATGAAGELLLGDLPGGSPRPA